MTGVRERRAKGMIMQRGIRQSIEVTKAVGLCLVAALPFTSNATGTDGFEPYQGILDRAPFGSAATVPEPPPPVADSGLADDSPLRMTSMYEFGNRIRVGLVDEETNRSYVVREGAPAEESGGFILVRADLSAGEAVLQKDGRVFALQISEEPVVSMASQRQAAAAQRPATIPRRPPWARRVRSTNNGSDEATQRQRPTREEMEARLRAYREEVDRQGLPPLPAPLTSD